MYRNVEPQHVWKHRDFILLILLPVGHLYVQLFLSHPTLTLRLRIVFTSNFFFSKSEVCFSWFHLTQLQSPCVASEVLSLLVYWCSRVFYSKSRKWIPWIILALNAWASLWDFALFITLNSYNCKIHPKNSVSSPITSFF